MAIQKKKSAKHFTYGDYLSWPNDERWELIEGEVYDMSPAPSRTHQAIVRELLLQIAIYLRGKSCRVYSAPFDVRLPESPGEKDEDIGTVVQPDLAIICDRKKLNDAGCRGAPDWIIEILSSATASKDLREKYALYEKHGVREYWVVDPANAIVTAYVLGKDGKLFRAGVYSKDQKVRARIFPKLTIDLAPVFAE